MTLWDTIFGQCKTIIVLTDLEPDDLVALLILSTYGPKDVEYVFLVGENCARTKAARMRAYLQLYNFSNSRVLVGMDSILQFDRDGYDILDEHTINQTRAAGSGYIRSIIEAEFDKPNIGVLLLKPPRELFEMWQDTPSKFRTIPLVVYGGFNVRYMFKTASQSDMIAFLKSWKSCLYYESFLVSGQDNTILSSSTVYKNLPEFIKRAITEWNAHCLAKFSIDTQRGRKVIDSIQADPNQFVNADCGLMAALFMQVETKQGDLTFASNYAVPVYTPDGYFAFVQPIAKNVHLAFMEPKMRRILELRMRNGEQWIVHNKRGNDWYLIKVENMKTYHGGILCLISLEEHVKWLKTKKPDAYGILHNSIQQQRVQVVENGWSSVSTRVKNEKYHIKLTDCNRFSKTSNGVSSELIFDIPDVIADLTDIIAQISSKGNVPLELNDS